VKPAYKFLSFSGIQAAYDGIWKSDVPLKVKFFVWLAINEKLNKKNHIG